MSVQDPLEAAGSAPANPVSDDSSRRAPAGARSADGVELVECEGTPVTIRRYRPADRDALEDLYARFDPAHCAQGIPPVAESQRVRWLEHLLTTGVNVVATIGSRIVGHACYTPAGDPEPELAVFVHQTYHDRGIGTELCRYVVSLAAAAGCEALVLDVEARNRRARHVYRSLGFEPVESGAGELHMRLSLARDPVSPAD